MMMEKNKIELYLLILHELLITMYNLMKYLNIIGNNVRYQFI